MLIGKIAFPGALKPNESHISLSNRIPASVLIPTFRFLAEASVEELVALFSPAHDSQPAQAVFENNIG